MAITQPSEQALFQIFHLTVTLGLRGAACQFLPCHSPCCGTVAQDLACGARERECVLAAYPTEWNHVVLHSMEAGNSSTTIVYCCTTLPPTQLSTFRCCGIPPCHVATRVSPTSASTRTEGTLHLRSQHVDCSLQRVYDTDDVDDLVVGFIEDVRCVVKESHEARTLRDNIAIFET
jgi:hypothetical protein